jgi:hypothetical protein
VVLVGNKADLEDRLPPEQARDFAREKGFEYREVSAKTGLGVHLMFDELAKSMLEDALSRPPKEASRISNTARLSLAHPKKK